MAMRPTIRRLYRGETDIQFIESRRKWYLASAVLLLICVISFVVRGFNFGVEFEGGTQYRIQVSGYSVTSSDVNQAFQDAGSPLPEPSQTVGSGNTETVVAKIAKVDPNEQDALAKKIAAELQVPRSNINAFGISSSFGRDITDKAIQGLIVFLIAVTIYISLRYQWRMAAGGIVALLHDLVIAAGVYSIIGFEVTPSTVVGLLTILGFSLYDTVVVYDKVAENAKDILAGSRMTYSEAANKAVNQTLMRSINTSLIALLPVAGLLFIGAGVLGVGTIKDLALILFVGIASGAYSSLFLATPVVVELTEHQPEYQALTRRVAAKRSSEAKKAKDAELTGVVAPARGGGGPAPAPKVGARPQRRKRK